MATLTATEILSDVMDSFKVAAPMLVDADGFATDFSSGTAVKDQQVIAHIRSNPTASTYDATTGYANGATEANTLVEDVPVTLDQHAHVPIKIDYLNAISDKKDVYQRAINDCAYVLGKSVVDHALGKVTTANFSQKSEETIANTDRETLGAVRKAMNAVGAGLNRSGIVNSDFFEELDQDTKIASQDYHGQQVGGMPLGRLVNVAGFRNIWEYPDLGTNNGTALDVTGVDSTDVLTTASAHGYAVGDPVQFSGLTGGSGISDDGTVYYVLTVPTATTLTISATSGGSTASLGSDISDGTIQRAENLSGFFFENRSMVVCSRLPDHSQAIANSLGIPTQGRFEMIEDPDSGLSLLGILWQAPGTFDNFLTVALLYGVAAGKQGAGNSAGAKTDYAGHRVVTKA